MSGAPVVFAPAGSPLRGWAQATFGEAVRVVSVPADLAEVPSAVVLCHPDERNQLEQLATVVQVIETRPQVHWGRLAHDLRGPLGVITGALGEIGDADPVVPLAARSAGQLAHLADCWECLAAPVGHDSLNLETELRQALSRFTELEPRRAGRIQIGAGTQVVRGDATRVRLGFARLWSHLTRRGRDPLVHTIGADGELTIGGVDPALTISPRLGRADLAVALLAPLTERWDQHEGELRWTPRDFVS